jgi:hypothetical protein
VEQLSADGVTALHILVDNAGVGAHPSVRQGACVPVHARLQVPRTSKSLSEHAGVHRFCLLTGVLLLSQTEQGFEMALGTNVLGTIYLTQRLLPLLEAGAPSRVVVLSSELANLSPAVPLHDLGGEKLTSTSLAEYGLSKLCDALYALEFSARYGSRGVLAVSTHPGVVATELTGKAHAGCCSSGLLSCGSLIACTPQEGAISSLYAATVPGLKGALLAVMRMHAHALTPPCSGCACGCAAGGEGFGPGKMNTGFTNAWAPSHSGYTPKDAKAMLDAALELIKAKGGKDV